LILECRLLHTFELGLHTQFVGEIVDVKAEENVMGKGRMGSGRMADIRKVKPLSFAPDVQSYYGMGNFIGKAFSIGKKG
jgi:flavin reductase (DIM6/NTAB) family NADH-FMN oxidoreductase RutF